jgi:glutamyl-tRNA synthetase
MLRFAPSPTGDMHIGNLRVAILNFIVSKQQKEKLIIRIEDTDIERNIPGKDLEILEILNKFNIEYSQVLYQSGNLKFHQQFGVMLLQNGDAFNCFCSEDDLEKHREDSLKNNTAPRYSGKCENLSIDDIINNENRAVVRMSKSLSSISFNDIIRGHLEFSSDDIDSFIILRRDKTPTYNFACAIDDMLSDVSLIIRGEDHISNTPKQILIQKKLGYKKTLEYAHLPIILNIDGKKMSKRDNASSIKWLLENGFIPEAISNYLVLLGNSTPTEIFSINEAIQWFDLKNLSKSPAKFDIDKLRFINREHLKKLNAIDLAKRLGYFDESMGEIAKIYIEEASTLVELKNKIDAIFIQKIYDDSIKNEIEKIKNSILNMSIIENYDEFKKEIMLKTGLKGKMLFKPLRIILTGAENGPELTKLYPFLKSYILELIQKV